MSRRRASAWPALIALPAGLAIGLWIAWIVAPVQYVNTSPALLRADYREDFRRVIAAAYQATGDLSRARARLAALGDPDPVAALADQAQRDLAAGMPFEVARQLAQLASDLQQASLYGEPPTRTPTATPEVQVTAAAFPTPSATPPASPTPRPTPTPTATPGTPFALASQQILCDPALPPALLQVEVRDAAGNPVAGVEVIVSWEDREDHFFTGLKAEFGAGYADFAMTPGVTYAARLKAGSRAVTDLSAPACQRADGTSYWGSIRLLFIQP